MDVCGTLHSPHDILICLPDKYEDFLASKQFLLHLQQTFPSAQLHLLLREAYVNLLDQRASFHLLPLRPDQTNFLGLPVKDLRLGVLAGRWDLALDLNSDFHLPSTYLCAFSGASLTACLVHRDREPFFNFQIQPKPASILDNKYELILRYLTSSIPAI